MGRFKRILSSVVTYLWLFLCLVENFIVPVGKQKERRMMQIAYELISGMSNAFHKSVKKMRGLQQHG